jgi:hypothetical protein
MVKIDNLVFFHICSPLKIIIMEMIILPQLRLAQLQTLAEGTIQITENLTEVAPQILALNTAFSGFQTGMVKSTSVSNKKTLDRTRDLINSGFFKSVETEQFYPYEDAPSKTALAKVVTISSKYGYEINRLSYDEQTAETDNLIAELEAVDLSALPAVVRWIPLMKTANDNFKLTVKTYVQEQTQAGNTDAASKAAIPLENALKELFTILFAHVHVTKTASLINAYKELTTLVNSYK